MYEPPASQGPLDFTSMVVMQELGVANVFSGDNHFAQSNLGFELLPAP
jgi:predicted nucleic acid-binding protein